MSIYIICVILIFIVPLSLGGLLDTPCHYKLICRDENNRIIVIEGQGEVRNIAGVWRLIVNKSVDAALLARLINDGKEKAQLVALSRNVDLFVIEYKGDSCPQFPHSDEVAKSIICWRGAALLWKLAKNIEAKHTSSDKKFNMDLEQVDSSLDIRKFIIGKSSNERVHLGTGEQVTDIDLEILITGLGELVKVEKVDEMRYSFRILGIPLGENWEDIFASNQTVMFVEADPIADLKAGYVPSSFYAIPDESNPKLQETFDTIPDKLLKQWKAVDPNRNWVTATKSVKFREFQTCGVTVLKAN